MRTLLWALLWLDAKLTLIIGDDGGPRAAEKRALRRRLGGVQ